MLAGGLVTVSFRRQPDGKSLGGLFGILISRFSQRLLGIQVEDLRVSFPGSELSLSVWPFMSSSSPVSSFKRTFLSPFSSKLAAYLKKDTAPTVAISIRHDERQRSIELLKIDSFDNKGRFWTGKIPSIKKQTRRGRERREDRLF
jgi:hypothetical protein